MKKNILITVILIVLVFGFFGILLLGGQVALDQQIENESRFGRGFKRITAPIFQKKEDPVEAAIPKDNETNDPKEIINTTSEEGGGEEVISEEEALSENIVPEGFSSLEEMVSDIGESGVFLNKDLTGYVPVQYEPDKYEIDARQQEAYVSVDFKDENGDAQVGALNTLNLSEEDIFFVLSTYTNYYENDRSLDGIEFQFEVNSFIERYMDMNEGVIFVSEEDDKIFVLMSQNRAALNAFVKIFRENNKITGSFLDYINKNKNLLSRMNEKLEEQEALMISYDQKVSQDIKDFGFNMWDAYIALDIERLKKYYANNVWFYADPDEWFSDEQDTIGYTEKKFYSLERDKLLEAYKDIKSEEFEEEFSLMQELKQNIKFYYIEDLMALCAAEDKDELFTYLNAQEQDVVLFAQWGKKGTGSNNVCTINGKFNFKEKNFWLLRNINDTMQVVTDFNE